MSTSGNKDETTGSRREGTNTFPRRLPPRGTETIALPLLASGKCDELHQTHAINHVYKVCCGSHPWERTWGSELTTSQRLLKTPERQQALRVEGTARPASPCCRNTRFLWSSREGHPLSDGGPNMAGLRSTHSHLSIALALPAASARHPTESSGLPA